MAAWRYEISLLVLKKYFTSERSERVKYFSTLKEKFHISVRPCKILYILPYWSVLLRELEYPQIKILVKFKHRQAGRETLGRDKHQVFLIFDRCCLRMVF